MAKGKTFRFTGLDSKNERVKGEITARDNLDAIRVLKMEMGVVSILEIKKVNKTIVELPKLLGATIYKKEKSSTEEIVRKIHTVKRRVPKRAKTPTDKEQSKKQTFNIAGMLSRLSQKQTDSRLSAEEMDKAVALAKDSIFRQLASGDLRQVADAVQRGETPQSHQTWRQAAPTPTVQLIPSDSVSANYVQVRQAEDGIGGQLKERLEQQEGQKVKLDWGIAKSVTVKKKVKIKLKELVLLSHKMSVLLRSGILLVDALYIVKKSFKRKIVEKTLDQIIDKVQSGESLSDSMKEFPEMFDEFYTSIVSVGESVGNLSNSFEDLHRTYKIRLGVAKKAKMASMYPIITLAVLVIMLFAASKFFIPQFKDLFTDSNMEIPPMTQLVFAVSDALPNIIIGLFIAAFANYLAYKYLPGYNKYWNVFKDYVLSNAPLSKKYIQIVSMFNFSSTMQIMLKNGIGLVDALDLSTRVIQNVIYKVQVGSLKSCVMEGMSFSESAGKLDKMDNFTSSMIRIGEESGNMAAAFQNVNEYQQEELKEFTDMLSELMQPAMLIMLAVIIVPVILAIYLPLMKMSSGASIDF